ncbi:MAG: flagellar FlbD family protein [Ktedonobacterales bacterium]|nr:flagellar FlbD family protein [Ktedonobacterales bacterium]
MIELTRFDGTHFYVNVEFIEFVETTPDTMVSLIDHKRLLVRETAQEIVARMLEYHRQIGGRSAAGVVSLVQRMQERQAADLAERDQGMED